MKGIIGNLSGLWRHFLFAEEVFSGELKQSNKKKTTFFFFKAKQCVILTTKRKKLEAMSLLWMLAYDKHVFSCFSEYFNFLVFQMFALIAVFTYLNFKIKVLHLGNHCVKS